MSCVAEVSEYKSFPGKFESSGELGERLYEMETDEEIGSVHDQGWFGLLLNTGMVCAPHAIVSEDSQGFFDIDIYESKEVILKVWARIRTSYEYDNDIP